MRRHVPHILSLAKGMSLCLALVLFIKLGYAAQWRAFLDNYFHAWPLLVYPVYWSVIIVGGFLLTFPMTLMQDHLDRVAEGQHEETPASTWLHGLGMETMTGTAICCIITALMIFLPSLWWLAWTILWTSYHFFASRAPELAVIQTEEEQHPHPDVAEELRPLVQPAGIDLDHVYSFTDAAEDWPLEKDLVLKKVGSKSSVFLPEEWLIRWETDELAAVILHKSWLTDHHLQRIDLLINTLTSFTCFGLFATLEYAGVFPNQPDPIIRTTWLFAWTIASLFLLQIPVLAYYRKSMMNADDVVTGHMRSAKALIRVLERADREMPSETETPRWAEILFFNTPSLSRRILRMKSVHPDHAG